MKKIVYEELPELLFDENKMYEIARREFTSIVKICQKYGFNVYSEVGKGDLSDFIESTLSKIQFVEQAKEIDINELSDLIFLMTGHTCTDAQDVILYSLRLLQKLRTVIDIFGNNIIKVYTE